MTLIAMQDKAKCRGQDEIGLMVCRDRNRCGRFLRPNASDYQVYSDFWKQGDNCIEYELVPAEHHITDEEPAKVDWD